MDKVDEKKKQTIKTRITKKRREFLEQIKKTPIVQITCEKTCISRATIYRWRNASKEFADAMDEALLEGKLLVNDVAESQLMAAIRERNMTAIVFWLKHNHSSYKTKIEVTGQINHERREQTAEDKQLLAEALRLAMPKNILEEGVDKKDNDNGTT